MTNPSVENVVSDKPDRLSLVKKLRSEGYESSEIIKSVLKERYDIDVTLRTVQRDIQTIHEDYRYIMDSLLKDGGFVIEFHETLLGLKGVKSRCKEAIIKAKELHEMRQKEIKVLMLALNGTKPHTESMYQSMLLQNDANLESTIQANEKIIQSVTKDFLSIQGKTEVMKGFDDFVATNKPKPVDMPEVQIPQLVIDTKKEDPNE